MANDQRKGKGTSREKQTKSATCKEKQKTEKQTLKKDVKKKNDPAKKSETPKGKSSGKKSDSPRKSDSKETVKKVDSSKKQTAKKTDTMSKVENVRKNDVVQKKVETTKKTETSKKSHSTVKSLDHPKKIIAKKKADSCKKPPDSAKKTDTKKKAESIGKQIEKKPEAKIVNSTQHVTPGPSNKKGENQNKKSEVKKQENKPSKTAAKVVSTLLKSKMKKSVGKPKSKAKVTPAIYKTRHNIGRRTAAERVGSYSEAEVAIVFPEGYWDPVKVEPSSSGTDSPEKSPKKRPPDSEKKGTMSKSPCASKKAKLLSDSDSKVKNSTKMEIDSDCEDSDESESDDDVSYKAPTIKKEKSKGPGGVKAKKLGGKYADLWPRAPRIKRTACLNAGAIMSVMYEKEEPMPKKTKVDTSESPNTSNETSPQNNKDSDDTSKDSESSSDSDCRAARIKVEKDQKRKVNLRVKLTAKKLTSKLKDIKKNIVKKKTVKKKMEVKKDTKTAPVFTPPRRMASLNAQAIWAAAKDDRLPKPLKGKQPKEITPKTKSKRDESPKKEKPEPILTSPAETQNQAATTKASSFSPKAVDKPVSTTTSNKPDDVKISTVPAITATTTTSKPTSVQPGMTSPHVQYLSNMPPGGSSVAKPPVTGGERTPAPSPMHERGMYRTPLPTPSPDVQILEIKPPMATPMPPGFSNIPPNSRQSQFMQSQAGNMYPSSYTPHHERFPNPSYPTAPGQYPMTSRPQRPYQPQHYPHLAHPHSQSQQSSGYPQQPGQPIYSQPSIHNQSLSQTMYSQSQGMFHKAGPESQQLSPRYMPHRMPSQVISSQPGPHPQHGSSIHGQSGPMLQQMPPFHPRYPSYQQYPMPGQSRTPLPQPSTQHPYPGPPNVSSSQNIPGSRTPNNPPQIQPVPSFPPNSQSTTSATKPKLEPHGTVSPTPRYAMRQDKPPMGYPHPSPVMSTGASAAQNSQQAQHLQSQQSQQQQPIQSQQQQPQQQQPGPSHQQRGGESSGGSHDQNHSSSPLGNTCSYPYPHGTTNVPPANHCQPYMVGSVTMDANSGYPVMPFRHYGRAFTVPSFEEAQQIRFGYYQPAGPLIQTVPHDPCCVPHPLGMPVPHPQVKVLVHNAPPGYAADQQYQNMLQAKQSSAAPESNVPSAQERSQPPQHLQRVETHEASTSPAKHPKDEKKDKPEKQKKSQERDRSRENSDEGEKLDIITIGEMDSASMKALSNRQKKSKKPEDKALEDKRNIKTEAKSSVPDSLKEKQPESSVSKSEYDSKQKSSQKSIAEVIKAESSKKAPPSKVAQTKKESDLSKADKAKKRKGNGIDSTDKGVSVDGESVPTKRTKPTPQPTQVAMKKKTEETSKVKPSPAAKESRSSDVEKLVEADLGKGAEAPAKSAQQKPTPQPVTKKHSVPSESKTSSVQSSKKAAAKVVKNIPGKTVDNKQTVTADMSVSSEGKILSKPMLGRNADRPSSKPVQKDTTQSISKPTDTKAKARKASPPVTTAKKTATAAAKTTPKEGPGPRPANVTDAVTMIVTGQKDSSHYKGVPVTDKCQALDLSSPVKNLQKPKFPVPGDNEPLNLVIHTKSPESPRTTISTASSKSAARSSSADTVKSANKPQGAAAKSRKAGPSSSVNTKGDSRSQAAGGSKDAIAKLREIRPSFSPSTTNVKIRPKPTATSVTTPSPAMVSMQIMATPRLQIPGQTGPLPVSNQTITIRRPSGESSVQRTMGMSQASVTQMAATHSLQSPIRTPITAPTLLGIVRPAQPGQLGLVQMQTYPTGLITTAGVISHASITGPQKVAIAKPGNISKHKPLQPKPPAIASTQGKPTTVSAVVSSVPASVSMAKPVTSELSTKPRSASTASKPVTSTPASKKTSTSTPAFKKLATIAPSTKVTTSTPASNKLAAIAPSTKTTTSTAATVLVTAATESTNSTSAVKPVINIPAVPKLMASTPVDTKPETSIFAPVLVASIPAVKHVTNTPVLKPVTSSPAVKPVTSTSTVKAVTSSPAVKPVTSTSTVKAVTSSPAVKPVTSTPAVKPVTNTSEVQPVTSTPAVKPVTNTYVVKPVTSTSDVKPVTSTPAVEPVASASEVQLVTSSPAVKPVTSTSDVKPVTSTPVVKPVTSSPVVKPVTSTSTVKAVTSTPAVKPITNPPAVKPVTSTPAVKPVTNTFEVQPITSTPAVKPVTNTSVVKPVTNTPTVKPVTSTPTVKPVTSTPAVEPVTSTPAVKPETSTSVVKSITSTPAVKPVTSTPAVEPVTSTPAVKPVTSTSVVKPETNTPAIKPVTNTPAVKSVTDTYAVEPVTHTSAVKPVPSTPAELPITSNCDTENSTNSMGKSSISEELCASKPALPKPSKPTPSHSVTRTKATIGVAKCAKPATTTSESAILATSSNIVQQNVSAAQISSSIVFKKEEPNPERNSKTFQHDNDLKDTQSSSADTGSIKPASGSTSPATSSSLVVMAQAVSKSVSKCIQISSKDTAESMEQAEESSLPKTLHLSVQSDASSKCEAESKRPEAKSEEPENSKTELAKYPKTSNQVELSVTKKTEPIMKLPSLQELADAVKSCTSFNIIDSKIVAEKPCVSNEQLPEPVLKGKSEVPVHSLDLQTAGVPPETVPIERSVHNPESTVKEIHKGQTTAEREDNNKMCIPIEVVKKEPEIVVTKTSLSKSATAGTQAEQYKPDKIVPSVNVIKVETESADGKQSSMDTRRVSSPGRLSAASSRSSSPRGKLSPDKALMASLTLSNEDAKALDSLILREPVVVLEEIDLQINPTSGEPEPSTSTGNRTLSPRHISSISPKAHVFGAKSATVMRGRQLSPPSKLRREERSPTSKALSESMRKNIVPNPRSRVGVTQAWQWEGEPGWKLVYPQVEQPPVLQECYPAVRHFDGDVIRVRDCVLVRSGPRKRDIPYVAKISALWKSSETGEMMMNVFWYYRPEHTETDRILTPTIPVEVFASKHRDVIPVACIEDRCYVLTFNEYCRYKSEIMRHKQGCSPKANLVPPAEEGTGQKERMPAVDANPETVFLCRKVYDVKLKRVLKNPQIHTNQQP